MTATAYPIINAERVWQRHMDLAKFGETAGGGVHRLALSDIDIAAHVEIARWAKARNYRVALDAIGNMFIRRPGLDPSALPVASGSHTDTQPFGGRFDGALGVLAAFEALESLDDAGKATTRPIDVIIFNNEEGARFLPGLSGSGVYAGALNLGDMLACTDDEGISMGSCVAQLHAAMPDAAHQELGAPYAGFVESHIEQGTVLEASDCIIGAVSDIQGNRRFEVKVIGEPAHSGTTPRARRKDAFIAATDIDVALRPIFDDAEDIARFTIGKFEVRPGVKSIVPSEVEFFIDFRHPSAAALRELGDQIASVADAKRGPCRVEVREVSNAAPLSFDPGVVDRIRKSAARHGLPVRDMISCAGHDARFMAALCPTAMVFVPCRDGVSHNEAEYASPEHIAAASQVICDVLVDMADG